MPYKWNPKTKQFERYTENDFEEWDEQFEEETV